MPREAILGWAAAWLIRGLMTTVRTRVIDRAGVSAEWPSRPLVVVFWHNRQLVMPTFFERHFPTRRVACLTSASKDGAIVAAILTRFGMRAIRGSSSRRGAAALMEMKHAIGDGYVVAITPDGPRGPRYRLGAGAVKLAQLTGAFIVPIHIRYSRFWQLKSWDQFMVPKPFAHAEITIGPYEEVRANTDGAAFEAERSRIERVLQAEPFSTP